MSSSDDDLPDGWTPDVVVDEPLVRRLLSDLPDRLAHVRDLPAERVAEGWDNSVWRVGRDLAARVPRRGLAVTLLEHEARWLSQVAAPLTRQGIPVPTPVHLSPAGPHHRYPWLLSRWVPGDLLEGSPLEGRGPVLARLAVALPALHEPAPPEAPLNPYRGPDLRDMPRPRTSVVAAARQVLGDEVVTGLLAVHDEGAAARPWAGPKVWCHGDLHPRNIVRPPEGGVGVLDFGDLTRGDPAVDLSVLWTTFSAEQRAHPITALSTSYDDDVWLRARGWAARFVLGVAGNQPAAFEATLAHAVTQLVPGLR